MARIDPPRRLVAVAPGNTSGCRFISLALARRSGGPAIVRLDGRIVGEYALNNPRSVEVTGPLGKTVIEIRPGRARVLSDPGPRQYCVRQGWLSQANALAVCAPNHVSLSLAGRTPLYDTVSY